MPVQGVRMYFNIPLGDLVEQTNLNGSVSIIEFDDGNDDPEEKEDEEDNRSTKLTYLNLLKAGIDFDPATDAYLMSKFIPYFCKDMWIDSYYKIP